LKFGWAGHGQCGWLQNTSQMANQSRGAQNRVRTQNVPLNKVNPYRGCWVSRTPLGHYGPRDSLDPAVHLLWAVRLR